MKIYTKTGDDGETGLFGGARVQKSHERVDSYGDVDELNSVLGLVRAEGPATDVDALLAVVQSELFNVGAELACVAGKTDKLAVPLVADSHIEALERGIDAAETELAPLKNFVLPGGTRRAAMLHVARTVCRRAERKIVAIRAHEPVRGEVIRYMNRLSDLLFTLARLENARAKVEDVPWLPRR
jgi:cob(I)alamin adenosyltransferase